MMLLLQLFWSFCQIGFTSFGGLSMIPLINSEMLSHGWMSASEVSDIVAMAEMTPGPLGLNCATFAGIRVAGLLGALAANFGMLAPTFTVCAVGAVFFERFKESRILKNIMTCVRPTCIGLIWAVILNLSATNFFYGSAIHWGPIIVAAVGAFLLLKMKLTIPKTIVVAAILGVFIC